ncbi:HAD family hydrolase [Candidatus Dojkabacteria bacterium]|uniref:HAD family hydrolase n=1 Tax=Candidatus Dojkabacteria bacterium TaxID=2099670 RepID=A0A955RJU9_9BACT|nr:HAD family hydrolase [Candidatus Dojkabacteria bacterium]
MISTILFDWDGCIVNSLPTWLSAYHTVLQNFATDISDKEIVSKLFGKWNAWESVGIPKKYVPLCNQELSRIVFDGIESTPLHTEVKETLGELYELGVTMGVITTNRRKIIERHMHHLGIQSLFDIVITADDCSRHKPHPDPILKALDTLNSPGDKTLMIGDSQHDILAAKNAGIPNCIFYPEPNQLFYKRSELEALKPTYFIEQMSYLVSIAQKEKLPIPIVDELADDYIDGESIEDGE